jgi:ATP-binding cassette subfamily C protein CydC
VKDLWRLARLLRPYAGWMLLGVLLSLATLIANVTLMAVSGWFIASMAVAGAAGVSMNYFTPAAIIRACAILRTGGRYGERLVTHETTLRLLAGLRLWFYERLEPLAPAGLQPYRSGDLLSRIRADIDTLDGFYARTLAPSATALLGGLALVSVIAGYDRRLGLILGASLCLAGVVLPWLVQRAGDASGRRLVAVRSDLRTAAIDGLQGLAELQVYGADRAQAARIAALSRRLAGEQDRLSGLAGLSHGMLGLAANLAMWLTLWVALPLVGAGGIAPPELAMLALFTLAAFEAVLPLPEAFQAMGATRAAARRLFELGEAAPPSPDPASPAVLPAGFGVRFEGVVFTYPGGDRPALEGIDLECPEGARIAVVGATGSGKSTLVSLLLRFRAPGEGRIRLGGVDIADLKGEDVRRRIAVASQHTHLFTASIRDNLLLARPQASAGELEEACRAAELHELIRSQPQGYDTQVGEAGAALSGGQARRLAIARALLKGAPILVLDEPTEGLDGPTARSLMATIIGSARGRSLLLITHRPEGLEEMDQILVLERGRVRARGDHRQLRRSVPAYRALWEGLDETPAAGAPGSLPRPG